MPAPKIAIEYLFSRPSPASMPNQIQSFGSPVFTMRMASHAQPIQKSGSKAFMVSRLSIPTMPGATSTARPARPWAKRFPPISRAITAVRATSAAPASAGSKRIAGSDSPRVIRTIQAITAISGG